MKKMIKLANKAWTRSFSAAMKILDQMDKAIVNYNTEKRISGRSTKGLRNTNRKEFTEKVFCPIKMHSFQGYC